MRKLQLIRDPSEVSGTFGILTDGISRWYCLEPEWLDNKPGISCIKPAPGNVERYECAIVNSPKYGAVYGVKGTEGRENVLLHWGNFAGTAPLKSNSEGCLMLGAAIGEIAGQRALLSSKAAFNRFMSYMEGEAFQLEIFWADV